MIMASFKTTFVVTLLWYFSYSFVIGCAQQYEYDYSAEARVSNWQSSRTRNSDAPSRFDVKSSSPDVAVRSRPRSRNRYEGDGIATPETARQYTVEQTERAQTRGRQRTRIPRQRTRIPFERRVDEVTNPAPVPSRRRPNRVTESTMQATEQFTPRLRVPVGDTLNQPRGFVYSRDDTDQSRQRVKEEIPETSTTSAPRPFSRGKVKAKIYDTSRKPSKDDDDSESDNYPPGFIEKIKNSENREEDAAPRRSRLRQRAAKTYPAIAPSDTNRFHPQYRTPTTETSQTEAVPEEKTARRHPVQGSRSRYTTPRMTTDYSPKPFRRRFTSTGKSEIPIMVPTTTIGPRQKYLSRLRTVNRQFKPQKVIPDKTVEEEKKEEALESAENAFYIHPEDVEERKQKLKNVDVDLESDASEENERVEMEKTSERPTTTTTAAVTTPTTKAAVASVPATRHHFSARFSRSNKTTLPEEVERSTSPSYSLALDSVTPAPINLTSLFDGSPDSTISIKALFNNSFNASSSVATNKTNSPETLTNTTTTTATSTARSSTVPENSSTTTKSTTKKKSQKKSRKSGNVSTATADGLGERPILRNIMSLFGNAETTTKRNLGKKKSSRGRTTTNTVTTTTTTTPGPREVEKIQTIINKTMEVIHDRWGGPAPARLVPRLALNALTPETSVEETTTRTTAKATTTTTAVTTTKTTTTTRAAKTTTAKTTITSAPKTTTTSKTTTSAPKTTTTSKTTTSAPKTTTTTSKTTTTIQMSSSNASKSASLSEGTPKKNCTSQFVFFDYNSNTPIPQQHSNFQQKAKAVTATTTSTTADYFVYGVYPNNTIVRKRAWKTFDYEKYHSPYVIFGIYPNNTIVKKFPNGTVINDEFMTSDNEIRDITGIPRRMSKTTTTTEATKKPETTTTKEPTTTTKKSETTTTKKSTTTTKKSETTTTKKPTTTTASEMRMAESATTENKMEDVTTEDEKPDSMFEIFENEIERLEREDEELGSSTTEATSTTVSDEHMFDDHYITGRTTTEQQSAEGIETTVPSFSITETTRGRTKVNAQETTESTTPETLKSSREGKSFSFNDIFGEEIIDSTTERASTTGSPLRETTEFDLFARLSDEVEPGVSTTTERTVSTTDSTDVYFDLQQIFQQTTTSDDSSRSFHTDIRLDDGPVVRPPTTEASVEEGSTRIWATTTEFPSTRRSVSDSRLMESTTAESHATSRTRFDSLDGELFGTILRAPTTMQSVSDNLIRSTATEVPTNSRSLFESTTTETPTAARSLFGLSESDLFGLTTAEAPVSTATEVPTTLRSHFSLSENNLFESTTRPVFRSSGSTPTTTTTEVPTTMKSLFTDNFQPFEATTSRSLFGLSESDLSTTTEPRPVSGGRLIESKTTEVPTTLPSLFGLSEANLFDPTSTESVLTTTATERRNSEESTMASNAQGEVFLLDGDLFRLPEVESSVTKSTMRDDEQPGIVNLAYRALGSSNTITTAPTPTLNYITSTMKSTNYKEKKVRMKMKRTSTTTPKSESVFIVTPETTVSGADYGRKGKVKFVTLTPGVIVTTDVRDENDIITMSSQHVQKVTKAPANIPDNVLTSVVGEIQQKSSSPIPDILKNVEKELQGNGISVSLARRIIEMAIERAVTTEIPETTSQMRETTFTTPYTTTRRAPTTTTAYTTPISYRTESTISNELSTIYNDLINAVNANPLSAGFANDYTESITKKMNEDEINRVVQGLWKEQTHTTTIRTTTTTKTSKRTKSSRNPSASTTTLSQNDKLLLEAILKQQNSKLSVQELDKIIENQIRLAEEVRKASKNMKKPRVTTTTTSTTTQTPPLFGFLISLFSGNSSPSNIPVTSSPIKQTRSRLKSSRGPGSMTNPKKPDPFKEAEVGKPSGERSTRGELVTAAIDVTKAVSKFMGTFLSSAAQSFQAFFSNFGRGR